MIIREGEEGYREALEERYLREKELMNSILKQCTDENLIEKISVNKFENSEKQLFHHKLPSGLHVYIEKMFQKTDGKLEEQKFVEINKDGPKKSGEIPCVTYIMPKELDKKNFEKYTKDHSGLLRDAINRNQAIIELYEDKKQASQITYGVKNGVTGINVTIGKDLRTCYCNQSINASKSTNIDSTHRNMADVMYLAIDNETDPLKTIYMDKFQQLDKMLEKERNNMVIRKLQKVWMDVYGEELPYEKASISIETIRKYTNRKNQIGKKAQKKTDLKKKTIEEEQH